VGIPILLKHTISGRLTWGFPSRRLNHGNLSQITAPLLSMNGWPAPEPVEASNTTLTIKVLKGSCWGIIQFGDLRHANQAIQEGIFLRGPWCEPSCMTPAVALCSAQDATISDTSRRCAPHQLLAPSARWPMNDRQQCPRSSTAQRHLYGRDWAPAGAQPS